jgi:predicted nucleic acid-binding protein
MTPIFLDTSYIIALEVTDDQHHRAALKHWQGLRSSLPPLVTTSYIFNEIVTFFNCRNQHNKAIEAGSRLLSSPSVQLVHVDDALFYDGWMYLKRYKDKSYSLTDCISFVLMERLKTKKALTFDKHFLQAGFKKLP